jgi:hypothetical protein
MAQKSFSPFEMKNNTFMGDHTTKGPRSRILSLGTIRGVQGGRQVCLSRSTAAPSPNLQ